MITRTFTSLAVMTALGVFIPVSGSHAFGLGKIELSSALNQPFKAQIPVTALREEERGNLQVQLASASEFERAGLERSYYLTQFEFNVVETNGVTTIEIRSKQAVKEPFVDLLLTATTGNGRLIREYTVLLDPPKDIFVKPQITTQPVVSTATPTKTATSTPRYTSTKYTAGQSYGPTDRHDTLWNIAIKTKPSDASVNQMMMALLDENPDAFTKNNINGLKAGYTLSIPAVSDITKRSKAQAIADVTEQNTLWKNRNVKPAAVETVVEPVVTEVPVEPNDVQADTMAIKDHDAVEPATEVTAQLKLVAPSDDAVSKESEMSPMGDDQLTSLTEQLTLAQETIETQTQENIDIKARMAAMEEQIETLRRLLSLKDPDLALMQNTLEKQADELATEQAAIDGSNITNEMGDEQAADTKVSDEIQMESADSETAEQEQAVSTETESEILTSEQTVEAESVADEMQQESAKDVAASDDAIGNALQSVDGAVSYISDLAGLDDEQVKSKFEQVKSYISEHKQTSALGGLALLLVIWLIIRFRNRPYVAWDDAVGNNKVEKQTVVAEPEETETHDDDNDDVDAELVPVVEEAEPEKTVEQLVSDADVYVSYGDFAKAKQALQAAYDEQPSNEDVMHKLLFVLFKQAQVNDFVALAEQYQNETTAAEWDDVVSWGQQIAPNEALFQVVADNTATDTIDNEPAPIETIELDNAIAEPEMAPSVSSELDDELTTFDANQSTVTLDEDLSLDLSDEPVESVDSDVESLDLPEIEPSDLDDLEQTDFDIDDSASNVMEFDLDINNNDEEFELNELDAVTDEDLTEANNALAESELEFDLGDFDQVDEAETKLDLAAAYIDMGDPSGAKSILEEVLTEGNDDQKARAEAMLSDIK